MPFDVSKKGVLVGKISDIGAGRKGIPDWSFGQFGPRRSDEIAEYVLDSASFRGTLVDALSGRCDPKDFAYHLGLIVEAIAYTNQGPDCDAMSAYEYFSQPKHPRST